jgi:hypothetical protein
MFHLQAASSLKNLSNRALGFDTAGSTSSQAKRHPLPAIGRRCIPN